MNITTVGVSIVLYVEITEPELAKNNVLKVSA